MGLKDDKENNQLSLVSLNLSLAKKINADLGCYYMFVAWFWILPIMDLKMGGVANEELVVVLVCYVVTVSLTMLILVRLVVSRANKDFNYFLKECDWKHATIRHETKEILYTYPRMRMDWETIAMFSVFSIPYVGSLVMRIIFLDGPFRKFCLLYSTGSLLIGICSGLLCILSPHTNSIFIICDDESFDLIKGFDIPPKPIPCPVCNK